MSKLTSKLQREDLQKYTKEKQSIQRSLREEVENLQNKCKEAEESFILLAREQVTHCVASKDMLHQEMTEKLEYAEKKDTERLQQVSDKFIDFIKTETKKINVLQQPPKTMNDPEVEKFTKFISNQHTEDDWDQASTTDTHNAYHSSYPHDEKFPTRDTLLSKQGKSRICGPVSHGKESNRKV